MRDYIRYGSYVFIAITIAYICATLRSCGDNGQITAVVVTPMDTAFSPVMKRNYRPASTPFEKPVKPSVKLPHNVREKDVKSVLIIVKSRRDTACCVPMKDTTAIITTKDGSVYVDKQNVAVQSVELITYQPPILDFGFIFLFGASFSTENVSPVVAICPLHICGAIQFPVVAADLHGIGTGVSYRWRDFSVGVIIHYSFNLDRQLKFLAAYNF